MKKKIQPIGNFDLAGKLQVINLDTSKWQTIADNFFATELNAKRIMKAKGIKSAWLYDGIDRRMITI